MTSIDTGDLVARRRSAGRTVLIMSDCVVDRAAATALASVDRCAGLNRVVSATRPWSRFGLSTTGFLGCEHATWGVPSGFDE